MRYREASPWDTPWGEMRYNAGVTPTDYTYTGQYSNTADFGLMFYNARWYDPGINQFTQPDTLIPNPLNSLDYNRYGYARYNPLRYTDPTGHCPVWGDNWCYEENGQDETQYDVTEPLVEEMQEAGGEGMQLTEMYDEEGGLFYVYSYMFGKYWRYGPKNIKVKMFDEVGKGVIICGSNSCRWVDYSTPGNILFGYAVESAGMPVEFYSWVGGFEQIGDDILNPNEPVHTEWCASSYCDDPYDLAAVQFGAQLYQEHGSEITLEIFQNELTTDILDTFQPPPSSFTAPFPPHSQDNYYHLGDFDYGR